MKLIPCHQYPLHGGVVNPISTFPLPLGEGQGEGHLG